MLTFLLVAALGLALVGGTAIALPFLVIGGVIWLVLLPIRLALDLTFGLVGGVLRLLFGLLGAVIGVLFAPLGLIMGLIVAAVALVMGVFAALISLITPLIPVALLLLLGWGIYRSAGQPSAAP